MSEKPIIFSGPMVRAILDGRKTMTRRIVKPQPFGCVSVVPDLCGWRRVRGGPDCNWPSTDGGQEVWRCPYGAPNETRLWVREAWAAHLCDGREDEEIHYRADGESCPVDGTMIRRWRPSIYMPRWASRITLEVTGVRVERAQDITRKPQDIAAEGMPLDWQGGDIQWFSGLWDKINLHRGCGYSWAVNPWVWVVDFQREE